MNKQVIAIPKGRVPKTFTPLDECKGRVVYDINPEDMNTVPDTIPLFEPMIIEDEVQRGINISHGKHTAGIIGKKVGMVHALSTSLLMSDNLKSAQGKTITLADKPIERYKVADKAAIEITPYESSGKKVKAQKHSNSKQRDFEKEKKKRKATTKARKKNRK